jgi:TATA-box binding protein (TBP) (component of TFIID and TFIIIB)
MNINEEWDSFLKDSDYISTIESSLIGPTPLSTAIYISTNTIISFLNQAIDLKTTFWQIPVISYHQPCVGVIKKQMKMNSTLESEVHEIEGNINRYEYGYSTIIQHIDNSKGIIKYKDIRKVTIGISKKDILSYRIKQKGAFYNCFVLIIRVCINALFKEFHVKIFNTGKIEIPGVQQMEHVPIIIEQLLCILKPIYSTIRYNKSCEETVLINSNFNCGYFINRSALYKLLISKYNISAVYDPCSYPGIQCKIYYKDGILTTPESIAVSFMIFRTGSILIVGKCSNKIIREIYAYLVRILFDEYSEIVDSNCNTNKKEVTIRKIKKYILLNNLKH